MPFRGIAYLLPIASASAFITILVGLRPFCKASVLTALVGAGLRKFASPPRNIAAD